MSARADRHFDQARRNRELAEAHLTDHAADPTYVQWTVTAAFYCAVHCLQGYLFDLGRNPRSHLARAREIADPANHIPLHVQAAYESLKQESERARYRLGVFHPNYVRRRILDTELKKITDFVGL